MIYPATPIPTFTLYQHSRRLSGTTDELGFVNYTLSHGPFQLRFLPNAAGISLLLHAVPDIVFALHQLRKPLCGHSGTGGAWDGRRLYSQDEPLLLFEGTKDFFCRVWRDDLHLARKRAGILRRVFGQSPMLLSSGRCHVDHYHRKSVTLDLGPGFHVHYSLVIFKERRIDDCFAILGWKELRLHFCKEIKRTRG